MISPMWYLEDADDGYCYIVSKLNGFILDISRAKWAMRTPLIIWPPPTVIANQKWRIDPKEGVVSQLNGQVLQVQESERLGSPVIMMKRKGLLEESSPQLWDLEPVCDVKNDSSQVA